MEVLTNYKRSLSSLNTTARDGMHPVAASPINNNRVRGHAIVARRHRARRGSGGASRNRGALDSGADGFQRALNEQGGQGYHADLIWKEGNDVVAMMFARGRRSESVHLPTARNRPS